MATFSSVSSQTVVADILNSFQLSDSKLQEITKVFVSQFENGLKGAPSGLSMAPTFVSHIPDGSETGTYLTLDFEATAFRVSQVKLEGQKKFKHVFEIYDIKEEMKRGKAIDFVTYVADCVAQFLRSHNIQSFPNVVLPLGVAFGFPLKKTALDRATLVAWTKGYRLKTGVGEDILQLIQSALDKKRVHVRCTAITNDTVAVLLAQAYSSGGCALAAIFGIGTNGAILEETNNIHSLKNSSVRSSHMIVNTEWGAFNSPVIPTTRFDNTIQRESSNPKSQVFEKLISWRYLGEIIRNILLSLIDHSPPILFNGSSTDTLNSRHEFDTYFAKLIEDAKNPEEVRELLVEHLEFKPDVITDKDTEIIRKVCEQIAIRAARLSACAIAAALIHKGHATLGGKETKTNVIPVAVSGEMLLVYSQFEERVRQALRAIIGVGTEKRVIIHPSPDSGALGAALCALEAEKIRSN